jgi:hypothetical protein
MPSGFSNMNFTPTGGFSNPKREKMERSNVSGFIRRLPSRDDVVFGTTVVPAGR